jgi:hypothetical protein
VSATIWVWTVFDPWPTSTVPVTLAAAQRVGVELGAEYRRMTSERRSGELLPEHLVAQLAEAD